MTDRDDLTAEQRLLRDIFAEPPSDEAAMHIDPEPPGVTLRPFTDAEVAALDAEPPSGGEVTAEELVEVMRDHLPIKSRAAAAILARFDVRRRKP